MTGGILHGRWSGAVRFLLGPILRSRAATAVALLSSGQVIAAGLPLLAAPILGRLYLPTDYGVLAAFMAIASLLGSISTFQFNQAVLAETSDRRAVWLVAVCCGCGLAVACLAALGAAVAIGALAESATYAPYRWWLAALPFSVLVAAITAAVSALANRRRSYRAMATLQIISPVTTIVTSIGLGALGWGSHGLIASYLMGQILAVYGHARLYHAAVGRPDVPTFQLGQALAWRHRRFAIYTMPAELIGALNANIPAFLLSAVGATGVLGAFARARQLVAAPAGLIGGSIAQVFRQAAAESLRKTGSCRKIFAHTFFVLAATGLVPFIILSIYAPDIFRFILGPNWTSAGAITRIIALPLYLGFICAPLANVFFLLNRQDEDLALSMGALVLMIVLSAGACLVLHEPIGVVYGYAASYVLIYIIYLVRGWQLVCGHSPTSPGGSSL